MFSKRRRDRFERLALPYLGRLLLAVRRRGLPPDLAQDLVQDTYLRAWKAFDSLAHEEYLYTWLYRILLNVIAEDRRRAARRQVLLPITDLENDYETVIAGDTPDPYEALLVKLEQARVHEALTRLPDEFALALALHDIDGLRYQDIADLTGVPLGTVMSRISRARRLLLALLREDDGAPTARRRKAGARESEP